MGTQSIYQSVTRGSAQFVLDHQLNRVVAGLITLKYETVTREFGVETISYLYFSVDVGDDGLGANPRDTNTMMDVIIPIAAPYIIAVPTPVSSP